jgi:hypothetical protein
LRCWWLPQPASRAQAQSAAKTIGQRPTGGSIEGRGDGAQGPLQLGVNKKRDPAARGSLLLVNVGCRRLRPYDASMSCLACHEGRLNVSGSNGAGLTLRAALASTRARRERARRAAQGSITEGGEVEREPDGGGRSAAGREQPESGGAESVTSDRRETAGGDSTAVDGSDAGGGAGAA